MSEIKKIGWRKAVSLNLQYYTLSFEYNDKSHFIDIDFLHKESASYGKGFKYRISLCIYDQGLESIFKSIDNKVFVKFKDAKKCVNDSFEKVQKLAIFI